MRLDRIQIRDERRLRVDDDIPASREPYHHIGAQSPIASFDGRLLDEIAMLEHAGHLHHPSQLQLAPAATAHRLAQRPYEISRFTLKIALPGCQRAHLRGQRLICALALLLDVLDAGVELVERSLHRRDKVLDGLLTLLEVALRPLLKLAEGFLREVEKGLVVRLQCLCRQGVKHAVQLFFGFVEKGELLCKHCALPLKLRDNASIVGFQIGIRSVLCLGIAGGLGERRFELRDPRRHLLGRSAVPHFGSKVGLRSCALRSGSVSIRACDFAIASFQPSPSAARSTSAAALPLEALSFDCRKYSQATTMPKIAPVTVAKASSKASSPCKMNRFPVLPINDAAGDGSACPP